MNQLKQSQLYLLRIAARDADRFGFVPVGETVWPLVQELPDDLVFRHTDLSGRHMVKLTEGGKAVVKYTKVVRDA